MTDSANKYDIFQGLGKTTGENATRKKKKNTCRIYVSYLFEDPQDVCQTVTESETEDKL